MEEPLILIWTTFPPTREATTTKLPGQRKMIDVFILEIHSHIIGLKNRSLISSYGLSCGKAPYLIKVRVSSCNNLKVHPPTQTQEILDQLIELNPLTNIIEKRGRCYR